MIKREDIITEAAHEALCECGGDRFYACPGCEKLVHREDTGNHALTCAPLRKGVSDDRA